MTKRPSPARRVHVDRIACTGHGQCAELLPELITLDEWGYPIIRDAPIPAATLSHARRAANACPRLALRVADDDRAGRPS